MAAKGHATELWIQGRLLARALRSKDSATGPSVRFVVYGQGRSGISLLLDLLGSHPEIHCAGESFSPKEHGRLVAPRRYIDACAALSPAPVYGCNVKIYHLTSQPRIAKPQAFLLSLHDGGWKFVRLIRRNLFRKSLSLVVARAQGRFLHRWGDGGQRLERMAVDPDQVVHAMREKGEHDRVEEEALGSIPHMIITYEQDLLHGERHQATCDRVFEFLDLSSGPVQTQLLRTSRARVSDYIVNHEELIRVVQENGFEVPSES